MPLNRYHKSKDHLYVCEGVSKTAQDGFLPPGPQVGNNISRVSAGVIKRHMGSFKELLLKFQEMLRKMYAARR